MSPRGVAYLAVVLTIVMSPATASEQQAELQQQLLLPPPEISDGLDDLLTAPSDAGGGCYSPDDVKDAATIYFVVLDAGSSGTRALVHQFRANGTSPLGLEHLRYSRFRRKPGLSAFRHFPRQCRGQLLSLLDEVAAAVPAGQRPRTCLLLRATAGFRLMDARSRYLVAREARDVLRASGYRTPALASVRMLSGPEEAKYTWLSVNYVLGNFDSPLRRTSRPVLEMGGGSVQIAFESPNGEETLAALSTAPPPLRLRARSYLGLGIRESVLRFVGHNDNAAAGAALDEDGDGLADIRPSYRSTCLAENLTLDFSFGPVDVQLNGTRSPAAGGDCLRRARELVAELGVRWEPELNNSATNWPVYAISGLFHLLEFLSSGGGGVGGGRVQFNAGVCPGRLRCEAYAATVGGIAEAAGAVCRDLPTDGPFKPYYCINLAVTSALLQSGMGLAPETPVVALGKQDLLGWTLGLSLDQLLASAATGAAAAVGGGCASAAAVAALSLLALQAAWG